MTTAEFYDKVITIMDAVIFDDTLHDDELFLAFVTRIAENLGVDDDAANMYACRAIRPYVWLAEKDEYKVRATGSKYVIRLKALVDGRFVLAEQEADSQEYMKLHAIAERHEKYLDYRRKYLDVAPLAIEILDGGKVAKYALEQWSRGKSIFLIKRELTNIFKCQEAKLAKEAGILSEWRRHVELQAEKAIFEMKHE